MRTSLGRLGPDPRKSGDWVVTPPRGGSVTVLRLLPLVTVLRDISIEIYEGGFSQNPDGTRFFFVPVPPPTLIKI